MFPDFWKIQIMDLDFFAKNHPPTNTELKKLPNQSSCSGGEMLQTDIILFYSNEIIHYIVHLFHTRWKTKYL